MITWVTSTHLGQCWPHFLIPYSNKTTHDRLSVKYILAPSVLVFDKVDIFFWACLYFVGSFVLLCIGYSYTTPALIIVCLIIPMCACKCSHSCVFVVFTIFNIMCTILLRQLFSNCIISIVCNYNRAFEHISLHYARIATLYYHFA